MDWRLVAFSVVGWAATIVASFFSARFGASESKRQFGMKVEQERLLAAANIIDALQRLSNEAGEIVEEVSAFESSNGRHGVRHTSLNTVQFNPSMFADAARLGGAAVHRMLNLSAIPVTGEKSVRASLRFVDEDDAAHECKAYAALFIANAFTHVRWLADEHGIPLGYFPGFDLDRLMGIANERHVGGELNIIARQAKAAARKTMKGLGP
jgi:hypothetical protein